jgi:hypothetical protein
MKTALIALAFSALAVSAHAETVSPADQFAAVCASKAHRSAKLETACKANEAPDAVKAGDRFKAVGIGAEVNTLYANIEFFKA